jgi:hypothetical protein
MAKGRRSKVPLTFAQKVQKDMPEFVDSVNGLSVQQLETRIATYQKELQDSEEFRGKDEALSRAKAEAKELAAPYNDVAKSVGVKTRYLIELIREKGGQ